MTDEEELQHYIAQRNTAAQGSLTDWAEFAKKQNVHMRPEVLEISYHKARTAITILPDTTRLASDKWLRDRNYESWL